MHQEHRSDTISLVPYDLEFLELSWRWLNDPEVKSLTNTSDFTQVEQKIWYSNLEFEKDYLIWGIKFHKIKIGVCGLRKITTVDCEYWAYLGEKSHWGKGIGTVVMQLLEKKAMEMKLKSIWLKVIQENARAIKLYKKQGFIVEEREGDLIFMRKEI